MVNQKMENLQIQETNMTENNRLGDIKLDTIHENDNIYDLVANQIELNLQEPNRELIGKIVRTLGVRKALLIYQKTRLIEAQGGLLVHDGSRKKTPGGVFFHLITNDKTIPKTVMKEIFYSTSKETKKKKIEEAKQRRRKTNKELRELLIKEGLLSTLPPTTKIEADAHEQGEGETHIQRQI